MKLVQTACRSGSAQSRRFLLLAPYEGQETGAFCDTKIDPGLHARLLASMQRFRGAIYRQDGAVTEAQLTPDGRHVQKADNHSWHLLVLNDRNEVAGCTRYRLHDSVATIREASVFESALAHCDVWSSRLRRAITAELEYVRREAIGFCEIGGWALAEELRHSVEALRMVLASYALSQLLGDWLAVGTATFRNSSAQILKRVGGKPLTYEGVEFPPYFDPNYGSQMEILCFDSRHPNPRYRDWTSQLCDQLLMTPIVFRAPARSMEHRALPIWSVSREEIGALAEAV